MLVVKVMRRIKFSFVTYLDLDVGPSIKLLSTRVFVTVSKHTNRLALLVSQNN